MRTVTLEFLRHGPPHNQLLSPLTRYMVLCGNHQAADVSVPFEHAHFLMKLSAFQYKETNKNREMQIAETAAQMSQILSAVPGLIAELADLQPPESGIDPTIGDGRTGITHLRLILSANELALLPFELANAGSAFPGAGQSLALQPHVPICITREVRRVNAPYLRWPSKPKILFAASSAGGEIPLQAHVLALRQAIDPWLHYFREDEANRVEEYLTILPMATVADLMEAVATGEYTHIHLLAHGQEVPSEYGVRYGVVLHDSGNPMKPDLVEGNRLAALLRPSLQGRTDKLAVPTVVTLASCDSGGVGTVVAAGASVAHSLHEAGIPLVIASQFPLSFAGSVIMTQVLYGGLIGGGDPRALLVKLRRELMARVSDRHDWASIVAYASLPQDIDRQLRQVRIHRTQARIQAALNHFDAQTEMRNARYEPAAKEHRMKSLPKLESAIKRMEELLVEDAQDRAKVYGLLASAYKRHAEVMWFEQENQTVATDTGRRAVDLLRKSRDHYKLSFEADQSEAWAVVQMLSLIAVLDGPHAFNAQLIDVSQAVVNRVRQVELARLMSEQDRRNRDATRHAWALGNLIELTLLNPIVSPLLVPVDLHALVAELMDTVAPDSPEVYSTKSQVLRYTSFFPQAAREIAAHAKRPPVGVWDSIQQQAAMAYEAFPETTRFERRAG